MKLKIIDSDFSICQIENECGVSFENEYTFFSKTDDELSLVCRTKYVPKNTIKCENGFNLIKIEGTLDFSLIGIIAKISGILAKENIWIFVISTYNTDYILVKNKDLEKAKHSLENELYTVE